MRFHAPGHPGYRLPSAIIVNFNAGALLADCIAALATQVHQIVVVDNASTDNSVTILVATMLATEQLCVIHNQRNLGFAAACNIGIENTTGDFLLFLNPDCVVAPDAVAQLLAALETDPCAGMAGGLLLNPDGTEQGGGRRAVPTPWRALVRAFGLYRLARWWPGLFFDFHLHKQPLPERPIEVEAISGAFMLVRRSAIKSVGPWDEGYFLHCEDLDWCMRFRRNGWRILFVPSARATHELGTCSRSRPWFVEWHKHRGMLRFYRKFFRDDYPGPLFWLVGAGVWLRFAAISVAIGVRRCARRVRGADI